MTSVVAAIEPLCACSACAGDYEDPERTAWADDEETTERENEREDEEQ
jgi:hypothetical protein